MVKAIVTSIVNGNEVQLVKEHSDYYICWGGENKSKQKLLTPKGRTPSQTSAYKQFLKACKAAQYLNFSKL
jgi:hypothetical protein